MAFMILRPDEQPERRELEFGAGASGTHIISCYTDSFVIRGTVTSPLRRLTDVLNHPEQPFLVMEGVTIEAYGSGAVLETAEFAQVNLSTVLYAFESADEQPTPPELRSVKVAHKSMVNIPPFRIVGDLHLRPEPSIRTALLELLGRFLPVTDATFWSDSLGIARTSVRMLAVNHARSQILIPFHEAPAPDGG